MRNKEKKKILKTKNYQNHFGSLLGYLKPRMNHKNKKIKSYSPTLINRIMNKLLQVSHLLRYKKFSSNCMKVRTHQNSLCSIYLCVKVPSKRNKNDNKYLLNFTSVGFLINNLLETHQNISVIPNWLLKLTIVYILGNWVSQSWPVDLPMESNSHNSLLMIWLEISSQNLSLLLTLWVKI